MNERIKQLCEQSKKYANESTKDFTGAEPVCWMDYYTEMLAELIVRECAGVSRQYSKRIDDMGSIIALDIEKHFGVSKYFGIEE